MYLDMRMNLEEVVDLVGCLSVRLYCDYSVGPLEVRTSDNPFALTSFETLCSALIWSNLRLYMN